MVPRRRVVPHRVVPRQPHEACHLNLLGHATANPVSAHVRLPGSQQCSNLLCTKRNCVFWTRQPLYVRRTAPSIGTSWTDDMRGSFTTSTSSLGFALVTESPRDSYQGEHASRHSQSKARWRVCRPNQKTLDGQPVRHTLKTAQKYIPQPVQANGSGSQP